MLDALKIDKVDLVTHDIGNMVGYAFAAEYPARVSRFVLIDAPLPGVGPWDDIVKSHALWHFSFWGPDAERLVAGRERIYLDRFWNEFSADPKKFDRSLPRALRRALRAARRDARRVLEQFKAFDQDAIDDKAFRGRGQAHHARAGARRREVVRPNDGDRDARGRDQCHGGIVPNSGHWIMEENPTATIALVTDFLARTECAAGFPR